MNLTIDVPGVRGLGEAGEGVGSIDEDAAEVVSLTEDGSLAEDRAGVRNMAKDVPGVRGLGKAGAGVRVLEEAIDRLNPGLNLGLVLSNVALSQELLEVGLIDKIKLKVFITTMYTALPAFSVSLRLYLMLLLMPQSTHSSLTSPSWASHTPSFR